MRFDKADYERFLIRIIDPDSASKPKRLVFDFEALSPALDIDIFLISYKLGTNIVSGFRTANSRLIYFISSFIFSHSVLRMTLSGFIAPLTGI